MSDVSPDASSTLSHIHGDEASQHFRHELRNFLHAILIQTQCAHLTIGKGNLSATRKHLSNIEEVVSQSNELLHTYFQTGKTK